MRRRLPSLNALRAFEAAARLGRIDAAADELAVTPAAVSHQVKGLEGYFGVALFRRAVRKIELTQAGQALLPLLSEGFDRLAEACRRLESDRREGVLTVSAPPAFAGKWLVARLQDFYDRHPDISIRLDGSVELVDFERDDIDVAIRYGLGPYPGMYAEPLVERSLVVVCAPRLVDGAHPIRAPGDLRHQTLIHAEWWSPDGVQADWSMWLKTAGVDGVDTTKGPRFLDDGLALEAAVQGQGVALVTEVYARNEIERGRVVRLFDVQLPTKYGYWLVCPPAAIERPKVKAFHDWIVVAMGAAH